MMSASTGNHDIDLESQLEHRDHVTLSPGVFPVFVLSSHNFASADRFDNRGRNGSGVYNERSIRPGRPESETKSDPGQPLPVSNNQDINPEAQSVVPQDEGATRVPSVCICQVR